MSKLTIYFNSGNQVTVDKIEDWSVQNNGGKISSLRIAQRIAGLFGCKRRIITQSINLSHIDCIVEH